MYRLLRHSRTQVSDENYHSSSSETVLSSSYGLPPQEFLGEAIFAAGSFWKLEAAFGRLDGVVRTATGYYGGTVKKPSHKQVAEGNTGHTEAVKVVYDKRRVSYGSLCQVFWESHDSTNKDYLNFGVGAHHRSAIFYGSEEERKQAQESKVQKQMQLNKRVVTKILPFSNALDFYLAQNHHQKYYLQKGYIPLCEALRLRSTEQFVESHLACRLNGILGEDEKNIPQKLKRLMESHHLPSHTKLVLENILEEIKDKTTH